MNKNFSNVNFDETSGTEFFMGIVHASADAIKEVLGDYSDGDGEKVNRVWMNKTSDGTVFTVYDWNERYASDKSNLYYHIGTFAKEDTEKVVKVLKDAGLDAYVDKLF